MNRPHNRHRFLPVDDQSVGCHVSSSPCIILQVCSFLVCTTSDFLSLHYSRRFSKHINFISRTKTGQARAGVKLRDTTTPAMPKSTNRIWRSLVRLFKPKRRRPTAIFPPEIWERILPHVQRPEPVPNSLRNRRNDIRQHDLAMCMRVSVVSDGLFWIR